MPRARRLSEYLSVIMFDHENHVNLHPGKTEGSSALCSDHLTVGVNDNAKIMTNIQHCSCQQKLAILSTETQTSVCFDNNISIVGVSAMLHLTDIVGDKLEVLIMLKDPSLEKLHLFCDESRRLNNWVPEISLPRS
ncbi:unnamed protein product [Menidia menidia]|uniref:(Atlantic silverside) hypothetical protein n=1 Tax=Menidia menidia TaxID=238744 RepID=A0A8S4AG03_9TELE|nr:unnamed protein product [Menidia menidia]